MAFERQNAVKLGICAALRKPYGNFSVNDVNDTFMAQVKELVPDYNAYRRNKNDFFELIQEIFDEALPVRVKQNYGLLAEIQQVAHGQKVVFKKRIGRARAKTFVTKVGLGGVFETFRLDAADFEVPTEGIGGAAVIDFERFLAGQEDIAECLDILLEAIDDRIYQMVAEALNSSIDAVRPTNTYYSGNAMNQAEFDKLITSVRGYGAPIIVCSPEFAATIPANYISATSGSNTSIKISDQDAMDIREYGVLKIYKGCPIVVLPQSFEDENNTVKAIDPSFAYIIPGNSEKIARVVLEGGVVIDEFKNKDRSIELSAYQKAGVAILHTNNWAIYENTSLT